MPNRRATYIDQAPTRSGSGAWSAFRRSRVFAALGMTLAGGLLGVMAYAPLGAAFAVPPSSEGTTSAFGAQPFSAQPFSAQQFSAQTLDRSGAIVELDDTPLVGAEAAPAPAPAPQPDAPAAVTVPPAGPVDPGSAQAYAKSRMASYGWDDSQYSCLYALWMRESSWNYRASNPYSGAYGIPQALPGSKMATAGADWATNPETQVDWGLGYISGRYGSPCAAWEHSESIGWY